MKTSNHPDPNHPANHLDGGNPDHMIGYIDPSLPPKIRAYLEMAKTALINAQGGQTIRALLQKSQGDLTKPIAMLVEKTIQQIETKFGPLQGQEHDQVAFFITGWIVSALQGAGAPGLDTPAGRHDLIGRILQVVDQVTQGQPGQGSPPQGGPPQQAQQPPQGPQGPQGAPMGQFQGGP